MPVPHDLSLPVWGPYNKRFVGFSHLADEKRGLRFDVDVFPGFYRRSVMATSALADGGAKLWQARPDLQHFVIRYELSQDVYCDMHVSQEDETARVRCEFVNDGDLPESLQINLCASIQLPTFFRKEIYASDVKLPEGGIWVDAQDYASISGANAIATNGFRRLERPAEDAVGGFALFTGSTFFAAGLDKDGKIVYKFPQPMEHIVLRYTAKTDAEILINGQKHMLQAAQVWKLTDLMLSQPSNEMIVEPLGADLVLDGFAVDTVISEECFVSRPKVYTPLIKQNERSAELIYEQLNRTYTISWDTDDFCVRELHGSRDDLILNESIHNHFARSIKGEGDGFYADLFLRPIFLEPHTRQERIITYCAGTQDSAQIQEKPLFEFKPNLSGMPYQLSQQLLAAATQMNVVWPQYFRGSFVKHNTPGKVWDSFYTWDSGMIALGLLSIDEQRAMECLHAYCMPENDPHTPYLQHGSPLLTQILAFKELLDLGRMDLCRTLYPGLRQGYRFLASLSETDALKTGLVRTWKIFYNSGGWDDYPPQGALFRRHLMGSAAPVISTSFLILIAKILSMAAGALGYAADEAVYAADVKRFSQALQWAWDEETGYFAYTLYDEKGELSGFLRDENGISLNMGFDGIYPLIAGEGTARQRERMMQNITEGMLTPYGVSAVDTRAPYFSHSGYWNGSVWMPHQWILWKALLGAGEYELANRIARTALDLWKREADATHNCYEHFMLTTGRGAGFHHFSGLSSPVLNWFCAYHVPGHIEVGYETRIVHQHWNEMYTEAVFTVEGSETAVLITMADQHEYTFETDAGEIQTECLYDGTYTLLLPAGQAEIRVRAK